MAIITEYTHLSDDELISLARDDPTYLIQELIIRLEACEEDGSDIDDLEDIIEERDGQISKLENRLALL